MKKLIILFIFATSILFSKDEMVNKFHFDFEDIVSLKCFDDGTCFSMTINNEVKFYKSTNYGTSWELIYRKELEEPILDQYSCFSLNKDVHYYCSLDSAYISIDGGLTFEYLGIGVDAKDNSIKILMYDEFIGIAITYKGYYITYDSWQTYEWIKFEIGISLNDSPVFINKNTIAYIKGNPRSGELMKYNLDNRTSESSNIRNANIELGGEIFLNDVFYLNENEIYLCGSHKEYFGPNSYKQLILKSSDAGNSWEVSYLEFDQKYVDWYSNLSNISFLDSENGIVVGTTKIIKTSDSGKTWQNIDFYDSSVNLNKMQVEYTNNSICIASQVGGFFRIEDISGVDDIDNSDIIVLQTTNELIISSESTNIEQLQIFNIQGILINEFENNIYNPNSISFDLSNLQNGIYSYRLLSNKKDVKSGKFIISK